MDRKDELKKELESSLERIKALEEELEDIRQIKFLINKIILSSKKGEWQWFTKNY